MTSRGHVLVTGSAGFIGFHLCGHLLDLGYRVTGVDAMTDYYDVAMKHRRQDILLARPHFSTKNARIEDPATFDDCVIADKPDIIVHLAGQAGVRYSIDAPRSYVEANLIGGFNLLEAVRTQAMSDKPCKHLLIASTSSVYGGNTQLPYRETDKADLPMSFYAATKKATEAMAHSYAHLYDLPTTMFRFFTVYGPWGRPDMALFKFTEAILQGRSIDVYAHGNMWRDFTYVGDIVAAIERLFAVAPPRPGVARLSDLDTTSPVAPFRTLNVGAGQSVKVSDFIDALEDALDTPVKRNMMPMQPGDVHRTEADISQLRALIGATPQTSLKDGIDAFVTWYLAEYRRG